YHWEDAVGPMETRIRRKNLIWGGELDPSFGTAEFIKFCRKLGAEPMICVNLASGTAEEAGNWVEYCNGTGHTYYANLRRKHGYQEPFNVKFWCIGNESYAEPDIGKQNDVQRYISDAMEFIKFMKLTDKSIKTVIVGCEKEEWNRPVLDALHAVTDYLSVHHYSSENGQGIYGPFKGEKDLMNMIHDVAELIDSYPDEVTDFNPWYRFPARSNKIKIALDEWNIWEFDNNSTYGLITTYCWRDALWTASVLNDIINHPSITMANMAQMVNVLAPIMTDENSSWYQTIAYPLRLYRHNMLGTRLESDVAEIQLDVGDASTINALNMAAVRNDDGAIRIVVVNRDFENQYKICLKGNAMNRSSKGSVIVLTGDFPKAVCTKESSCVHEIVYEIDSTDVMLLPGSITMITY
ncbi:MAG: Alpha-N-arabinofuranosidase, partial [Anaerocolumna sp.]|nr:Alpha-N-arabinofuranosidase [Anaerocolumna sp.]